MTKLNFNTDYKEAIKLISEGNPGALRVLFECYEKNFLIGQFIVAELDIKGIYGWRIWELYKDKCGEDLDSFIREVDAAAFEKAENMEKILGRIEDEK
jgi:hypothetical protein